MILQTNKFKNISIATSLLVVFAVALAVIALRPGEFVMADSNANSSGIAGVQNGFADVVEEITPTVVMITVSKVQQEVDYYGGFDERFKKFFEPFPDMEKFFDWNRGQGEQPREFSPPMMGAGSGFVIHPDGYIVTNAHVVDEAEQIEVTLDDGEEYIAEVVGIDRLTDLAVLKIDADEPLHYAKFGDSKNSRVGDWVIAVGTPFGLTHSVSVGVISGKERVVSRESGIELIQIDAAVNKGNSGGPLFNLQGEVIGVNTMIFSRTGLNAGVAFAIPSALTREISDTLIEDGQVKRGWLGVAIQPITPEIAEVMQIEDPKGALIAQVIENSPASSSGLQVGDIIVSYDNQKIERVPELPQVVRATKPGTEVKVEVWRDGKVIPVTVKVSSMETNGDETQMSSMNKKPDEADTMGFKLAELNDANRERYGIDQDTEGVIVLEVEPGSPAAESGIRPGDIIKSVNRNAVDSVKDAQDRISSAANSGKKNILMLIEREGGSRFMTVAVS